MNRNLTKIVFTLSFFFSIFTIAYSHQEDIRDRMKQRLPSIITLKDKGIIGEDSNGYLAFVGTSREGQNIVNAENADRKTVYQMIAKKTGSTIEVVAEKRAKKLAQNAPSGHYIKVNGTWIKK